MLGCLDEVGEGASARIAVRPGRYTVTSHLGQTLPPISSSSGSLEITLTDAPQYFLPAGGPGHASAKQEIHQPFFRHSST